MLIFLHFYDSLEILGKFLNNERDNECYTSDILESVNQAENWSNFPRHLVRRAYELLWRSRFHNIACRLSRIHDRSLVQGANTCIYAASYW